VNSTTLHVELDRLFGELSEDDQKKALEMVRNLHAQRSQTAPTMQDDKGP
jgi:hypothetical protein